MQFFKSKHMTNTEQNKETVARFNKEFIEQGNMAAFKEIIADDFLNQTAFESVPKGPEGVLYFFNNFLKPAFPDLRVEIFDQVAEGDEVTTRKAFHATHSPEFRHNESFGLTYRTPGSKK